MARQTHLRPTPLRPTHLRLVSSRPLPLAIARPEVEDRQDRFDFGFCRPAHSYQPPQAPMPPALAMQRPTPGCRPPQRPTPGAPPLGRPTPGAEVA